MSLIDKRLAPVIEDFYFDKNTLKVRKVYVDEDVHKHIKDFIFLLDYNFVYSENSSYEQLSNQEYYDLCGEYNLDPYEEYSKEELSLAIFGDLEK